MIMPRRVARLIFAWLLFVPGLAAAEEKSPAPRRLDRYGDPLPPGAVARLGTVRLLTEDLTDAVAFSPDGKLLATGGYSTPLRLWDVSTGKTVRQLRGQEVKEELSYASTFALAFSPRGRLLFSGGQDKAVHVWEVSTGREIRR